MPDIDRFVPITEAKNTLLEIVRQVQRDHSTIAITKGGVPAVIVLSSERYAGLLETMDILSDEQTVKSLRKAIKEAREGNWVEHEEVFGR